MKSIALLSVLLASILCASCQLDGKQGAAEPGTKIAVISLRDILTRCDTGAKVIGDIQSRYSDRRIQLGLLEQDIRKLREETKDGQVKGRQADLLRVKFQTYAQEERKLQQDVRQEEGLQFKPILEVVNKVLDAYAKEKNLSAIQERVAFVYYNRDLDITEDIIKRVNQEIAKVPGDKPEKTPAPEKSN
jgi:Skp family chaperone for outer membrane proteins